MADEEVKETEEEAETAETEQRENEADKAAEAAKAEPEPEKKPDAEPEAKADWREMLTDAEAKKQAERFASLDDVFKSNADFRKQLSSRISVPGKDADEKDVAKFRKALGVPEKPDDYTFELPEGMEVSEAEQAILDELKPVAHEQNIPAAALQSFVLKFKELEQQVVNEHTAALERQREEAEGELKKEWGKDFDANLNVANRAMTQFAGDEIAEFLNGAELKDGGLLGNHPQMVRLFAKLGRQMSEDGVMAPVDKDEAKGLEEQVNDLTKKAMTAQLQGDRDKAAKLFKEVEALSDRLHGDAPIVGSAGRAA